MKRKGKNKSKDRQIIDFEENLDASTACSNVIATASNDINRSLSISNNNISSSSTNNNNRILSISNNNTFSPPSNNNIFSTSSNNNNPALLSININPALLSTNISPVPSSFYDKNSPGRKSISNVWRYAKKSDDGKTAICLLCDYTCSIVSHSTSTILCHLTHKHNKYDLINNSSSSSSTKPHLSEKFKR
ncbi:unnamed protein product, partial [Rotaria sp. Silwood2]